MNNYITLREAARAVTLGVIGGVLFIVGAMALPL